jgi:hypothetical protein
MKATIFCTALLAFACASIAQTQSGSSIGAPSTGTSADTAGAAGTTAPRSPDTSVGTSGAASGTASTGSTTLRCDTMTGDERAKCLKEQRDAVGPSGTASPSTTAK